MVAPIVELVCNRLREALDASYKQDYATLLVAIGQAIELLDVTGTSVTGLIPEDVRVDVCNKVLEDLTGIKVPDEETTESTDGVDLPDELDEAIKTAFKETFGIDAQIVGYSPPS